MMKTRSLKAFPTLYSRAHTQKPLCPRFLKLSWVAEVVLGSDFASLLPTTTGRPVGIVPGNLVSIPSHHYHTISALPVSPLKSVRLSTIRDESVREVIVSMFGTCGGGLTVPEVSRVDQLREAPGATLSFFLASAAWKRTGGHLPHPPSSALPFPPTYRFSWPYSSQVGPLFGDK